MINNNNSHNTNIIQSKLRSLAINYKDENNKSVINEIIESVKDLKIKTKKMKPNVFYQMKVIV